MNVVIVSGHTVCRSSLLFATPFPLSVILRHF